MQKLIESALKSGVSITISGTRQQASGKQRKQPRKQQGLKGKDTFDCHGGTHDGVEVKSMKGQIRGDKAAIATSDDRYIGTFTEHQLAELEVAAKTCRAKLIAKRESGQ